MTMAWRNRTTSGEHGDTKAGGGLISDVLQLNGTGSDTYVLQMSYDPSTLTSLWGSGESPYLAYLNGSTWRNAGSISEGNVPWSSSLYDAGGVWV